MMENPNESELRHSLHSFLSEAEQVPATDQIYYDAYRNGQLINNLLCAYTLLLAMVVFLVSLSIPLSKLSLYLAFLFLVTLLRLYHYNVIRGVLQDSRTYFLIADATNHLIYVQLHELQEHMRSRVPLYIDEYDLRDPVNPDQERKLRVLTYDIKMMAVNLHRQRRMLNKIQFVLYQLAHFIGIAFLLFYPFESGLARAIICLVILVGTYQYIEFYLLMIFLACVLPYYFLRNFYIWAINKYRNYKL
jgi:hypothetical protein